MTRAIRSIFAALALVLTLSACEVGVRYSTVVEDDGGGVFTFAITLDAGARAQAQRSGDWLAELDGLFDALRSRGWRVTRQEPSGGVALSASRTFDDAAGFGRALDELRTTPVGSTGATPAPAILRQDFSVRRSFFKTEARFAGAFTSATDDQRLRALLLAAQDAVRFEVRARLPGGVQVRDPNGVVEGSEIVWRPALGTDMTFAAEGSALRIGPLLGVTLGGLLLLAAIAWVLFGRKQRPHETLAIIPEAPERTIVVEPEPEPVEQVLAIERDPVEP